jgi:hypothetical protein
MVNDKEGFVMRNGTFHAEGQDRVFESTDRRRRSSKRTALRWRAANATEVMAKPALGVSRYRR